MNRIDSTIAFAQAIRTDALQMVHHANASHIGSCLSMTDILAVLYNDTLRVDPTQPEWPERDRFILSKGHGAAAIYAALAEKGFFPKEWLEGYCDDDSPLLGHISHKVPGVEVSTGSLGHGLAIGCGMAKAGKEKNDPYRVFVLLSDGELNEGSCWESISFASHHGLDNLTAIVDYNKIQSFGTVKEVLNPEPLASKWQAFNWVSKEIDGHDVLQITHALAAIPFQPGKPSAIIAHTVKGKGVSFMENQLAWHYKSPNDAQLKQALAEINAPE